MIFAGLVLAFFCWLIPRLLVKVVESDVARESEIPAVALWVVGNREFMPLLSLPVIVIGLVALTKIRPRWLWAVLGLGSMLLPAVLMIYTFIVSIGILYEYQEL